MLGFSLPSVDPFTGIGQKRWSYSDYSSLVSRVPRGLLVVRVANQDILPPIQEKETEAGSSRFESLESGGQRFLSFSVVYLIVGEPNLPTKGVRGRAPIAGGPRNRSLGSTGLATCLPGIHRLSGVSFHPRLRIYVLEKGQPQPTGCPFRGNRWVSLVDEKKPPGKPGKPIYVSTKTTKKDTYHHNVDGCQPQKRGARASHMDQS